MLILECRSIFCMFQNATFQLVVLTSQAVVAKQSSLLGVVQGSPGQGGRGCSWWWRRLLFLWILLVQPTTIEDVTKVWRMLVLCLLAHSDGQLSMHYGRDKIAPAYSVTVSLGEGRSLKDSWERDLQTLFPWVSKGWLPHGLLATTLLMYWWCHNGQTTGSWGMDSLGVLLRSRLQGGGGCGWQRTVTALLILLSVQARHTQVCPTHSTLLLDAPWPFNKRAVNALH